MYKLPYYFQVKFFDFLLYQQKNTGKILKKYIEMKNIFIRD